jgi:phenylacetate-coenzyme A ligase PaaK-like adenylate-forming protein
MLCVSQSEIENIVTYNTSGTTDNPKRIFFSREDLAATAEFFTYGMQEFTKPGDSVLILFPGKKEGSIGSLLEKALLSFGAVPINYGLITDYDDAIGFIAEKKINVITGLPRQVLQLSALLKEKGRNIEGIHSVLLSADYAARSLIDRIEKNLNCTVYEHYGMTETCFGGGVQSASRQGFHMRSADFLYEITESGEIVFTSLIKGAMPLIRLKTGDTANFIKDAYPYPRLGKVTPRAAEKEYFNTVALSEALYKIENILDFQAEYANEVLRINVRSLDFDKCEIESALKPVTLGLPYKNIEISPWQSPHTQKNTMEKHRVKISRRP